MKKKRKNYCSKKIEKRKLFNINQKMRETELKSKREQKNRNIESRKV